MKYSKTGLWECSVAVFVLVALLAAFGLGGCDQVVVQGPPTSELGYAGDLMVVELEGHKYVGGYHVGVVHAASCECLEGGGP